jgi:hypothetical protein
MNASTLNLPPLVFTYHDGEAYVYVKGHPEVHGRGGNETIALGDFTRKFVNFSEVPKGDIVAHLEAVRLEAVRRKAA